MSGPVPVAQQRTSPKVSKSLSGPQRSWGVATRQDEEPGQEAETDSLNIYQVMVKIKNTPVSSEAKNKKESPEIKLERTQ